MMTPTVADTLKYANLQMAAEALYRFDANTTPDQTPGQPYVGAIDPAFLTTGNRHASKFTPTEAAKFAAQWEVVEHISNTKTGFSGTLFKDKSTGELVMSIKIWQQVKCGDNGLAPFGCDFPWQQADALNDFDWRLAA